MLRDRLSQTKKENNMNLFVKVEMDFFRDLILSDVNYYKKYNNYMDEMTSNHSINIVFKEDILPFFKTSFTKTIDNNLNHLIKKDTKFKIKGKISKNNFSNNWILFELTNIETKHYTISEYKHFANSLAIELNSYLYNINNIYNLGIYKGIVEGI